MKILYVTDNKNYFDQLTTNGYSCYYCDSEFMVGFNTVGTVIKIIKIKNKTYEICLNSTKSKQINDVDQIISESKSTILVNLFNPSEKAQFNFDMMVSQLENKHNIVEIKRIWINDPGILLRALDTDVDLLQDNIDYKNISHFYLAKKLIDYYWHNSSAVSHSSIKLSIHQYYILSLLLQHEEQMKGNTLSDFYTVEINLDKINGKVMRNGKYKFKTIEDANKVYSLAKNNFTIIKSKYAERTSSKHLLFTFPSIVKIAKDKANIEEVLRNLYKKGYITNPDTRTPFIHSSMVEKLINNLTLFDKRYSHLIDHIESHGVSEGCITDHIKNNYVNDYVVSMDHTHAILPLPKDNLFELSHNELSIYDMIVSRYMSVFLPAPKAFSKIIEGYGSANTSIVLKKNSDIYFGSNIFECSKLDVFEELLIDTNYYKTLYPIGSQIELNSNNMDIKGNITKSINPLNRKQIINKLINMGKPMLSKKDKAKYRHFSIGDAQKWNMYIEKLELSNIISRDDDKAYFITPEGLSFIMNSKSPLLNTDNLNNLYIDLVNIFTGYKNIETVLSAHIIAMDTYEQSLAYSKTLIPNYSFLINNFKCTCGAALKEHENFLGCSTYPNCNFVISKRIISGDEYVLTERDLVELLQKKRTSSIIENFTFKSGKKANITLEINASNRIGYVFCNKKPTGSR